MRKLMMGIAAFATIGTAVALPLSASAAPADGPGAAKVYRVYVNDGHATFNSHGEHLYACDDALDGDTIKAKARYKDGDTTRTVWVTDGNGFGGGCGHYDADIPEGRDVDIQVCHVEDGYCSGWRDAEA